jgi:hypothetical protein
VEALTENFISNAVMQEHRDTQDAQDIRKKSGLSDNDPAGKAGSLFLPAILFPLYRMPFRIVAVKCSLEARSRPKNEQRDYSSCLRRFIKSLSQK